MSAPGNDLAARPRRKRERFPRNLVADPDFGRYRSSIVDVPLSARPVPPEGGLVFREKCVFAVNIPDDALAPVTPRGLEMGFSPHRLPEYGNAIIVRDRAGRVYVRRYINRPHGHWAAHARHPDYPTLYPKKDGIQILAVGVYRALQLSDTSDPRWMRSRLLTTSPGILLNLDAIAAIWRGEDALLDPADEELERRAYR